MPVKVLMRMCVLLAMLHGTTVATYADTPLYEQRVLTPFWAYDWAFFGYSIDIFEKCLIAGAPYDFERQDDGGAAHVFVYDGNDWYEQAKLIAFNTEEDMHFGSAVSIYDTWCAVGADGDYEPRGSGRDAGSVLMFERQGEIWVERAKLRAPDARAGYEFGYSVDLWENKVVVGSRYWGDDDNFRAGSAYVFSYDGNTWSQEAQLRGADVDYVDQFGYTVALQNDVCYVGAPWAIGQEAWAGAVYIFKYDGSNWIESGKLTAPDGDQGDCFGISFAVQGNQCVVGARYDEEGGFERGSAYIFIWDGENWVEEAKLLPSDEGQILFGNCVSLSNDICMVGSMQRRPGGRIYVFQRQEDGWSQVQTLDIPAWDAYFRPTVAAWGDLHIVSHDRYSQRIWNGGAAYVYSRVSTEEPSITVTQPNGVELARLTDNLITWQTLGDIGDDVRIELYRNMAAHTTIIESTPNTGSYEWAIPRKIEGGTDYKIKVSSIQDEYCFDFSDTELTIPVYPVVTVDEPNGGEMWTQGTTCEIKYHTDGNVGSRLKIELYHNGLPVAEIIDSAKNLGTWQWRIPSFEYTTGFKLKITSVSDPNIFDFSDEPFMILAPLSTHVDWISVVQGIDRDLIDGSENVYWPFCFGIQTDDAVSRVQVLSPTGYTFGIDDLPHTGTGTVNTSCTRDGQSVQWQYVDRRESAGEAPYGDGPYQITVFYHDGGWAHTTVVHLSPDGTAAIPQPAERPDLTYPGTDASVYSPVTLEWNSCVDPNATSIAVTLTNRDSDETSTESYDIGATHSLPFDLIPGVWSATLSFNRFRQYVNEESVDVYTGKYSQSQMSFEVAARPPEIVVRQGLIEISSDPNTIVDLGSVQQGQPGPSTVFTIENSGQQELALSVPFPGLEHFTVTSPDSHTLSGGEYTQFTVTLNTERPGTFVEMLSFENTDSDETPYRFSLRGTVLPMPDLTCEINSDLIGLHHPGDSGNVSVTLKNAGMADAQGTVNVDIYALPVQMESSLSLLGSQVEYQGTLLARNVCKLRLKSGQSKRIYCRRITLQAALAGDYRLIAIVDPTNDITESDETNNSGASSTTLIVEPPDIDLVASVDAEVLPASRRFEPRVDLSVTISNQGLQKVTGRTTARIYASRTQSMDGTEQLLATWQLAVRLSPGRTQTFRLRAVSLKQLTSGSYFFIVNVDPDNTISEMNENNNIATTNQSHAVVVQ